MGELIKGRNVQVLVAALCTCFGVFANSSLAVEPHPSHPSCLMASATFSTFL